MGKRGPKPADEFGDQKAVLSTRITQHTRDALEAAAALSGRPLSREVEYRLRRSFDEDEKLVDLFGGRQLFALMRAISSAMMVAGTGWVSSISDKSRRSVDWLNDPDAYQRVVQATNAVLEALRPPGERSPPAELVEVLGHKFDPNQMAAGLARLMMEEIGEASPTQPAPNEQVKATQFLFRRIASDLGQAHQRLKRETDGEDNGSR